MAGQKKSKQPKSSRGGKTQREKPGEKQDRESPPLDRRILQRSSVDESGARLDR